MEMVLVVMYVFILEVIQQGMVYEQKLILGVTQHFQLDSLHLIPPVVQRAAQPACYEHRVGASAQLPGMSKSFLAFQAEVLGFAIRSPFVVQNSPSLKTVCDIVIRISAVYHVVGC